MKMTMILSCMTTVLLLLMKNDVAAFSVFTTPLSSPHTKMMVGSNTDPIVRTKSRPLWTMRLNAAASNESGDPASSSSSSSSSLTLYGHPGTRSPLVNWAVYELGLDDQLTMGDLQDNPHPFQKIPCLTDDDGSTVVFESGAILEYLQDNYGNNNDDDPSTMSLSRSERGAITSWIVWANASLDPVCFIETPQGKVVDTGFRYGHPRLDQLNELLSTRQYLLGDKTGFTVADVAVASYLLYVPQFFPRDIKLDQWPHLARYMARCASREAYGKAFGKNVQNFLLDFLDSYVVPTTSKK